MSLTDAAERIGATRDHSDVTFRGVSTDSRTIADGELFVALRGPNFDGHDHVATAKAAGAIAAMVADDRDYPLPTLRVSDTVKGLGQLASHWRRQFETTCVSVTGSNGKTTVKEMAAAIARQRGKVLATEGNLNNEIGVPLTLFRLAHEHLTTIVEMGANHPGEIARLAAIAAPDVGVVTQCAPAHLEGFGDVDDVAHAKGELFSALPKHGRAIINADDDYAPLWHEMAGDREVLTFSLHGDADVWATFDLRDAESELDVYTPQGSFHVTLKLPGVHNITNALAATAAMIAVGAPTAEIAAGLTEMRSVPGRLQLKEGKKGARIIDDTYNANPASFAAGIAVLMGFQGRHWLVLGDMGELGEGAVGYHKEVGVLARAEGVDRLCAVGELSRHSVASFGVGAEHYDAHDAIIDSLTTQLDEDVTVLVKGSRVMGMERVVLELTKVN